MACNHKNAVGKLMLVGWLLLCVVDRAEMQERCESLHLLILMTHIEECEPVANAVTKGARLPAAGKRVSWLSVQALDGIHV